MSLEEILNVLQTYERDQERLPEAVAFTVNAIVNTYCKSISSLRRVFSLLRLPEAIRQALLTAQVETRLQAFPSEEIPAAGI